MATPASPDPAPEVQGTLGDPEAYALLRELVSLSPTNLEDPVHGRWEKPHYARVAEHLVQVARRWGLSARIFDPRSDLPGAGDFHGVARPNVVVDLDVGSKERVIVMAHYDVVPVPAEQLSRWQSPPHTLTYRSDGRLYGRGAADDLGSGVVPALLAAKQLRSDPDLHRNLRLLLCCDEETGGEGGIESIKAHDSRLPPNDPSRFLGADVVLIPDGDPRATAGSSGLQFLDAKFAEPVELPRVLAYGQALVGLGAIARSWVSVYSSPDWPDHGAPDPHITGRATVSKWDASATGAADASLPRVTAVRAETDASNQIAQSVTIVIEGPSVALSGLTERLRPLVSPPYRLDVGSATSLKVPAGALQLGVIGLSAHAGYPHRGHNPVPAALRLLDQARHAGLIASDSSLESSFSIDLRLPPEMPIAAGLGPALDYVRGWIGAHDPVARIDAPPERGRGGYSLPPTDPALRKLERILESVFGATGVYGEYGGTDASSLVGLTTPAGAPLPALVFGLMDRTSHIHEAEENLEPAGVGRVLETIRRFVVEP